MKKSIATVALIGSLATLTGCGVDLHNRVLPGAKGTGADGYTLHVEMKDVENLVPNSEVKYKDATVGTVTGIALHGWTADVSVALPDTIKLPPATVAKLGQKSLLGSQYIELTPPAHNSRGRLLGNGDTIPLTQTGQYTTTEDLAGTLSLWLNGSGLEQINTVATELNKALGGNESQARALIDSGAALMRGLNNSRRQIVGALAAMNRISGHVARQQGHIDSALNRMPAGLRALNSQQAQLVGALESLGQLSRAATNVINASGDNLVRNLHNLQPALAKIRVAASAIPDVLDIAPTILFPIKAVPYAVKGDFLNASLTVDLTIGSLQSGLAPGTPLDPLLRAISTALDAGNPLTGPLTGSASTPTTGPTSNRTATAGSTRPPSAASPAPATPATSPTGPPNLGDGLRDLLNNLGGRG